MECIWDDALLHQIKELPPELLSVIRTGTNREYLQALTTAALDARYTYVILAHCEDLSAHICASLRKNSSLASSISALGRIVPYAPYLSLYATQLLENEPYILSVSGNDADDLLYLLGLFRLLRFDHRLFRRYVRSGELASKLGQSEGAITYLLIRILQIQLSGADQWFEHMIQKYLGPDTPEVDISAPWDEKVIDYRFLSLWEEDRSKAVRDYMSKTKQKLSFGPSTYQRKLLKEDFHPTTSLVGNILFPSTASSEYSAQRPDFVVTKTILENLRSFSQSLKLSHPIILTGAPGSGKTTLIRHVAEALGYARNMVTLHLNEQSDAKLLLGIYTTNRTGGSFVWKPGVLTAAVRDGQWVVIEDIDRAPNEVIGILLRLIEKRELFIPGRSETVVAAQGFRLIATVRSTAGPQGEEKDKLSHMLGVRHWYNVRVAMPRLSELKEMLQDIHPILRPLLPQLMAVYERLCTTTMSKVFLGQSKTGSARSINLRDLLKWCHRISFLLADRPQLTSHDLDNIFLEAIDCFAGAIAEGPARDILVSLVAEDLRIDPVRCDHLLIGRDVPCDSDKTKLRVGRFRIPRWQQAEKSRAPFSLNPHTARMLERVAASVTNHEPLLLVGETGVGKTTAVQYLANHLGKRLVTFNLSQQSEAGDLLGGFKPVNTRTLIIPLKDEFDDLFFKSFSSSKNQLFLDRLRDHTSKNNWKAVCKLWRQALVMVDQQRAVELPTTGENPSKKRKVDTKSTINFSRWDAFAAKVEFVEQRLKSGSDSVAFEFVESRIVQAVRDGDWVLLDEINLASDDTLETIADLIDSSQPSILLTEAGHTERIYAHSDFHLFAAMNPATDVGKRELPMGIRSRFTEHYVESPEKDFKSLHSIVQVYLGQNSVADPSVASDVASLHQELIALASQNKLVDGAGQRPQFSLRTLTRTLTYARLIEPLCNLRRSLHEGFQMSFMTLLDQESASVVQPLIQHRLFPKLKNPKVQLQRALRKPDDGRSYVQGFPGSLHWIRKGRHALQDQSHYIITPFVSKNLENLVRAASTGRFPILIQGPTSSGKTSMIEYLAKRTGQKFVRINNHEHTDLQEYLGTYVSNTEGRLRFQDGVLVEALRDGHWVVLDELNLAPTDVLEALNRLLDDNRELLIPETQEVVRPHPDFMLFATQNPAGLYGGRKTLSRAFRNRFLELHFDDIPVDELQEILHRRTLLPESRCKRIVNVYKELSILRQENRLFEQKSFATLRDLFRWALRKNETIEQLAINGYMLLCERVRKPEERTALKAVMENVMSANGPRVSLDEDAIYSESCDEIQQYINSRPPHKIVWTKAMRRLYVLVSKALQNNEPVLIVGETGSGKTTVCQMLACAHSQQLHMLNAHQNLETGDLIGSQRPVRNRAAIASDLRTQLTSSSLLESYTTTLDQTTQDLTQIWDLAVSSMSKDQKIKYQNSQEYLGIQALRRRYKALFEWVDGSLVQAMTQGAFFLLDEISLAEDSVLERINSVLEPERTILLAEKGSFDSVVQASSAFQFFATMNPGGDYGKRELSPALRNRFTEIWVPALSDHDDILQILRGQLISAAMNYAGAMLDFAIWFKDRYDASASSSLSLRDILAWVEFVNTFAKRDVEASIVQGAAMVYVDTLGANPAGLLNISARNLDDERRACLSKLGSLVDHDISRLYPDSVEITITPTHFCAGPFSAPRVGCEDISNAEFVFDTPTTRSNVMRVMRALQVSKPIMLEGSPGVGKTALVAALAESVGIPLTRINLSDQTEVLDLFGSDVPVEGAQVGSFVWRDAPFLSAMKKGDWVLLDEMNLASQSVLEGLNACLDHRGEVFIPELGQVFRKHPSFRLFAAQNPHHQGGGRKGLPVSFVNRFTIVYADTFKSEDLVLICKQRFPSVDIQYIEQAVFFVSRLADMATNRREFGSNGAPWEFNFRDISRWLSLVSDGHDLVQAGSARDFVNMLFTNRFRESPDRQFVERLFFETFHAPAPLADLFHGLSSNALQVGLGLLRRDTLLATPQKLVPLPLPRSFHMRTYESVMICIQQKWPVVLSGSSGAGKTSLIEKLASIVGARVMPLSLNSETDVSDLIGGYEQNDFERQLDQALSTFCMQAERLIKLGIAEDSNSETRKLLDLQQYLERRSRNYSVDEIRQMFVTCDQEIPSELEAILGSAKISNEGRFDWIDGPVIEAVRQGAWLILDNANLCSPSVLDRLNALLEPNGVLAVNERCTPDGNPSILQPHPNFRIFLTVDPRFGELSRAMRNRAVELHIINDGAVSSKFQPPCLQLEARMSRFRMAELLKFATSNFYDNSVVYDHFALQDQPLILRLHRQLQLGLFADISSPEFGVKSAQDSFDVLTTETLPETAMSGPPMGSALLRPGSVVVQTIHPLNNSALIRESQQRLVQAQSLAAHYDLNFSLNQISREISKLRSNPRLLQRLKGFAELLPKRSNKAKMSGSVVLGSFNNIVLSVSKWLAHSIHHTPHVLLEEKATVASVLAFCQAFVDCIAYEDSFNVAFFNAFTSFGMTVCSRSALFSAPPPDAVMNEVQASLSCFQADSNGFTGRGCFDLWRLLEPETVQSIQQLDSRLQFESLLDSFDQATSDFQLPLHKIIDLRTGFRKAYNMRVTADADFDQLTEEITTVVKERTRTPDSWMARKSHFTETFEQLCQHIALLKLTGSSFSQDEITGIEVLAGRKTIDGMDILSRPLQLLPRDHLRLLRLSHLGSGLDHSFPQLKNSALDHGAIYSSLLQRLDTVDKVEMRGLDLLESEMKSVGRALGRHADWLEKDIIFALDKSLESLTKSILSCFSESQEMPTFRDVASQLLQALNERDQQESLDRLLRFISTERPDDPFTLITQRFSNIIKYLLMSRSSRMEKLQQGATAWLYLGLSCLELFVPDHTYDPALGGRVERSVFLQRRDNLSSMLAAVRKFRGAWTGEVDSFRARLLEDELAALGPEPADTRVFRPGNSQLSDVLKDFDAIMRIVQPLRKQSQLYEPPSLDPSDWDNMWILRSRLMKSYPAYIDLTTPVIGFIDCISIGSRIASRQRIEASKSPQYPTLATITPFQNAQIRTWLSDDIFLAVLHNCRSFQEKLYLLSVLSARASVVPVSKTSPELQSGINNTFREFYTVWKDELNRDQKLTAKKSNLYRYRGLDDITDDATPEELEELFPGYENRPKTETSKGGQKNHQQSTVAQLATLFHSIYNPLPLDSNSLTELLLKFSQLTFHRTHEPEQMVKLPAVLCAMQHQADRVAVAPQRKHDVYRDPNIAECKNLISVVEMTKSRFDIIHNSWPEHATPLEVLRCCNSILEQSHMDPLMTLLPFVETLIKYASEWQKVASKEYSAQACIDAISDLIVRWRQLELSSWSGLYDREDEQCREHAASWWYIAYEVIVIGPSTMDPAAENSERFFEDLVETLSNFLAVCGVGEFSTRLRLIQDFQAALTAMTGSTPTLLNIRDALAGLTSYYSHFEQRVVDYIADKRKSLEKDITSVIQLASWKDRNIESLKASSEKSHRKLFKLVRKYQLVLSQPVAPLVRDDFPSLNVVNLASPKIRSAISPFRSGESSLEWKEWTANSSTLHDPSGIAMELVDRTRSVIPASNGALRIDKFLSSLEEESNDLRKATPSIYNEENKHLIQHLKTRKRRLLADVLRDCRLMGFQTSLSVDFLHQQRNLCIVLAHGRAFPLYDNGFDSQLAEYEFSRMAHVMSTLKEASSRHSDDLTTPEVNRCTILLESMLGESLKQRNTLQESLRHLQQFETGLEQVNSFSACSKHAVLDSQSNMTEQLVYESQALIGVLNASAYCVNVQSNSTDSSYPRVLENISQAIADLKTLNAKLGGLKPLPIGIVNEEHLALKAHYQAASSQITSWVESTSRVHPELNPTLSQLLNWTARSEDHANSIADSRITISGKHWAQDLLQLVNKATECAKSSLEAASPMRTLQADKAWLRRQQNALTECVEDLRLGTIAQNLTVLMQTLRSVQENDNPTLFQLSTICKEAYPILEAYRYCAVQTLSQFFDLHVSTCRMTNRLGSMFVQLAQNGFCTPPEEAGSSEGKTGELESGTGLGEGEGEGAEDISKDIKENEDLSELAQESRLDQPNHDVQVEKDAVDMADEDLAGQLDDDDGSDGEAGSNSGDAESQEDLEEETGPVDGTESSAVDGKKLNSRNEETKQEKEGKNQNGTKDEDFERSGEKESGANNSRDDNDSLEDDEISDAGTANDQEHNLTDPLDQVMDTGENLELPEDLIMDGDGPVESNGGDSESDIENETIDEHGTDIDQTNDDIDMTGEDAQDSGKEEHDEENANFKPESQNGEDNEEDREKDLASLENDAIGDQPLDGLVSADSGEGKEDEATKEDGKDLDAVNDTPLNDENTGQSDATAGSGSGRRSEQQSSSKPEADSEDQHALPFKQLGDILKKWYNQHRNIDLAQENTEMEEAPQEIDPASTRFEHIPENIESEHQALGAASNEQARALDSDNSIAVHEPEESDPPPFVEDEQDEQPNKDSNGPNDAQNRDESNKDLQSHQEKVTVMVGNPREADIEMAENSEIDEMESVDEQLINTHISRENYVEAVVDENPGAVWAEHEARTRNMALILTEHLRLILHPTQATKMRGDFRTGKRLNMKKIIPYIASSYKRDKIWMRRSVPSKRSYQIMLAVDDSKSMAESDSRDLAFDTLCLVAKSMSMLEVGELCIVGFGEDVNVVHDFSSTFTSEAGAQVFQQITFSQSRTNVRKLLESSIQLFRTARARATNATSNLWQLLLVVSDGVCENHAAIRRLVREAFEEKIMIVFIVVDAAAQMSAATSQTPAQSILDLQTAEFTKDSEGEMQLSMVKYMDTFPFKYYLIVRDVLELPSVLAGALRQWFSEVMETG